MKTMLLALVGVFMLICALVAGGLVAFVGQMIGLFSQGTGGIGLIAIFAGVAAMIYLIPSIVAINRQHHQIAAIATLNIVLGWTFLGWAAALVWAMTATRGLLTVPVQPVE